MRNGIILILLILIYIFSAGCGLPQPANSVDAFSDPVPASTPGAAVSALPPAVEEIVSSEPVNSFSEFLSADDSQPVTIESYLQEKQAWSDGKANIHLQDEVGAYFVFNLPCSEEEYLTLKQGQKLRIRGYKTDFSGQIQITDAVYSVLDGMYVAEPEDISDLTNTDELYFRQNRRVSFHAMTVEPMFDGVSAFYYGWDNSGSMAKGSDLYFTASNGGESYTFLVKAQLCGIDSDAYRTVQNLHVEDIVDLEGILCWYNGPQPLLTSISVLSGSK